MRMTTWQAFMSAHERAALAHWQRQYAKRRKVRWSDAWRWTTWMK